jgi:hypothetical protein
MVHPEPVGLCLGISRVTWQAGWVQEGEGCLCKGGSVLEARDTKGANRSLPACVCVGGADTVEQMGREGRGEVRPGRRSMG